MPTETITTNGRASVERPQISAEPKEEQALREVAMQQLKRIHGFKVHVLTWAIGVPTMGVVWMLTEYFQDNQWPSRFADADNGVTSTWNPWFFWAAGIWTAVLLLHGVRTYAASLLRQPTEADVDREVERMRART